VVAAYVFNATGDQHLALLQRHLRYKTLAALEVGSEIISTAIAIGMALAGYGYWAIVASVIAGPLVITVGAWVASGWIPGLPRRVSGVSSMLRHGGAVTLSGLVAYTAYNSEKILLGRYFGPDALGLYSRAFELINLPTLIVNNAISVVAFSSLSRLQTEPGRFKDYFLKGYSLVVSVTLPTTIACAVFADDIILVALGPNWTEASTIFRFLAPTILIFGMINPLSWLLLSLGLQERSLKIGLVLVPVVISAYLLGLPFGPNGVALAFSAAMILWLVPHIRWCLHDTPISVHELLSVADRPLISGAVAAIAAACIQHAAMPISSPIIRLALAGTVMLAVYVFVLLFVMKQSTVYFGLLRALRGVS
jgi:PST family polysaccharide transporter